MDSVTLAAWGELIGGIAVVASLIDLASQIRQNSRLLRTSLATVGLDSQNLMADRMTQDSDLAHIYFSGLDDQSALSEHDRERFDLLIHLAMGAMNIENLLPK
ncbi:MAG: hypothetical protein JRG86_01345 [Deltaproteobacteria bacterium]|jgi:hypothetical protein|nr:hypothetical protein [Deltaproteobacteria bacterium]MBW2497409.1 hypothetical protein [Deltaproteobacteria bacterium]